MRARDAIEHLEIAHAQGLAASADQRRSGREPGSTKHSCRRITPSQRLRFSWRCRSKPRPRGSLSRRSRERRNQKSFGHGVERERPQRRRHLHLSRIRPRGRRGRVWLQRPRRPKSSEHDASARAAPHRLVVIHRFSSSLVIPSRPQRSPSTGSGTTFFFCSSIFHACNAWSIAAPSSFLSTPSTTSGSFLPFNSQNPSNCGVSFECFGNFRASFAVFPSSRTTYSSPQICKNIRCKRSSSETISAPKCFSCRSLCRSSILTTGSFWLL